MMRGVGSQILRWVDYRNVSLASIFEPSIVGFAHLLIHSFQKGDCYRFELFSVILRSESAAVLSFVIV